MRDYDFADRELLLLRLFKLNKMITRECGTAVKRQSV
jgi:hypothetical protein